MLMFPIKISYDDEFSSSCSIFDAVNEMMWKKMKINFNFKRKKKIGREKKNLFEKSNANEARNFVSQANLIQL